MDFMKWISSLDEFLYEVMSWLVFFPVTLWRTLSRPLAMMDYADRQLALPERDQYAAALSPPLFLALALLLAHGVSVAFGQSDAIVESRRGLAGVVNDDVSALILRMVLFAGFPLFAAVRLIRRRGVPLDRPSLRLPFYAQCYPAAVFALGLSLSVDVATLHGPRSAIAAALLAVCSLLYYAVLETRWFARSLAIGHARAALDVAFTFAQALALFAVMGFLFTR